MSLGAPSRRRDLCTIPPLCRGAREQDQRNEQVRGGLIGLLRGLWSGSLLVKLAVVCFGRPCCGGPGVCVVCEFCWACVFVGVASAMETLPPFALCSWRRTRRGLDWIGMVGRPERRVAFSRSADCDCDCDCESR